jgi:hypothetical protein
MKIYLKKLNEKGHDVYKITSLEELERVAPSEYYWLAKLENGEAMAITREYALTLEEEEVLALPILAGG